MKKLFVLTLGVAVLGLLAACAPALYSDTKTEETFRMIPSAALRDHKIKTIVYDYELSGQTDFNALRISMKEGGKLNLRYTGKDGRVSEFRLNGESAAVYEPDKRLFADADPEVTRALRFFYDMNFIGPEYLAKRITLVNRVPERLDGKGPHCYEYVITPKEDYHVKNIRVFSDVKRHIILRVLYDRCRSQNDNGDEVSVSNSFRDVMIRDGIAVPVLVETDFLGNKYIMKLKKFRSNMPVADSIFELTKKETEKAKSTEVAKEQAAVVKPGEKAESASLPADTDDKECKPAEKLEK